MLHIRSRALCRPGSRAACNGLLTYILLFTGYQSGDCGYCKGEDTGRRTPDSRALISRRCPTFGLWVCVFVDVLHCSTQRTDLSLYQTNIPTSSLSSQLCHRYLTIRRCLLLCIVQEAQARALPDAYGSWVEKVSDMVTLISQRPLACDLAIFVVFNG